MINLELWWDRLPDYVKEYVRDMVRRELAAKPMVTPTVILCKPRELDAARRILAAAEDKLK